MPVYPCDATVHACGEPVGVRCGGMFRRWGGELSGSRTRRRRALSRARFYRATCAPQCLRSVCPAPELRAMSGGEAGLAFQYLDSLVYGARARSKRERLCHQPPSLPVLSSPPWSQAGFPPARALSLCASCGQSLSYAAGGHSPAFFPAGRTHHDPCGAWEDDPEARFDVAFFDAATSGYAQGFGMPTGPQERARHLRATRQITLELAVRFLIDVVHDAYFGFDAARYSHRRAHNVTRRVDNITWRRRFPAPEPAPRMAQMSVLCHNTGPQGQQIIGMGRKC